MRYKEFDRPLFIVTIIILGLGLLFLYSASMQTEPELITKQAIWIGIALLFFLIGILIDYHKLLEFSHLLYGLCILLLIFVLTLGPTRFGAQRWMDIGPVNLQPSELYKVALIMVLSRFFGNIYKVRRSHFIVALIISFLPAFLILKQPDLGSSLILVPLVLTIFWVAGIDRRFLILLVAIFIVMCPIFWQFLKDYQRTRLLVFINPNLDPLGAGYTIIQSRIAIGSGGLFGKGWLQGTQNQLNFLPERHTDFIFSVVGEEWGIIGGLTLLCLYLFIVRKGLMIARQTSEPYGRFLATGISGLIGFEVFVNIGMTMGLLPVVGLPLPLISYGGSSLVTTMFMLGCLQNVKIRRARF